MIGKWTCKTHGQIKRLHAVQNTLMVEEAKHVTLHIEPVMSVRLHVHRNVGTCVRVTEGALPFTELWLHHSRTTRSSNFGCVSLFFIIKLY
jgi:hypothetical protein